jgi:hypothetical protein
MALLAGLVMLAVILLGFGQILAGVVLLSIAGLLGGLALALGLIFGSKRSKTLTTGGLARSLPLRKRE